VVPFFVLRGRRSECQALDRFLGAVRAGDSRVLVVRGAAGVGKSALLEYLVDRAAGCRVARAAGVQSEMELAFAGLHQLCRPMLAGMDGLPAPQRDALGTAFGLSAGDAPDRFLVGLAVLSLLSEVAEGRPLVCLVDDAQWLDRASAQALAFVARRLLAEPVGLVFAARGPAEERELAGLPQLAVDGLRDGDAHALLSSVIAGPLDDRVRDRIVAETGGNPLALLELPRGLTAAELAGGFGLPDASALPERIEETFGRRLAALPAPTRALLLVAAAEPFGEAPLVWRAAERLGIGMDAAARAEAAGLCAFGARVRFRHPLVRSAVYRAATPEGRRTAHRALADATDPAVDPDRRAWHRAQAAVEPDEAIAEELERSAGRAQGRGGLAAAGAFLEQTARLTPDLARRAQRALAAAQAKHQAGASDAALALLVMAETGPSSELHRARVELLRAQISFAVDRGRDAPPLLLEAAERLAPLDAALARETYLEAFSAALFAGRLAGGGGVREVAEAIRAAPWGDASAGPARPSDLLLDGLAVLITEGYAAGTPMVQRALRAFRDDPLSVEDELRWLWLASHVALELGDDESWDRFTCRQVELARDVGALSLLPIALTSRFGLCLFAGDLAEAASLVEEVDAVVEATGGHLAPHAAMTLAAWRGREAEAAALIDAGRHEVAGRGEGLFLTAAEWASAVLYNGLGRYDEALIAARRVAEQPTELGLSIWVRPELIEAAARTGQAAEAAGGLALLAEATRASGTDWALGIEARSRALLSEGDVAEGLYREAIERLGHTRMRVALGRAHLLHGEWLRRQRRRLDARGELRIAHEMFMTMGVEAFAERAARELLATGETARRRTVPAGGALTIQEAQTARLARDGLSNPEIGARLFISPRTVEYHLHKVFAKLGITSRGQLGEGLSSLGPDPAPLG
jgi:DNA-binding CsgD family transcriptional regulator